MIALLRSFFYVITYSFRRQLLTKKSLLCLALLSLLVFVTFTIGIWKPWRPSVFGEMVVLRIFGLFYIPVVTIMFGTGALGDDREEGSLVYLLTRPIPRSLLYVGKLLAVLPQVLFFSAGGFVLLHAAAGWSSGEGLQGVVLFLPALTLGALAYVSFFHFLGAAFRHSTVVAIAYVFFVEVLLGRIPGIMKRVSIAFYTWSKLYEDAASIELKPPPIFLPVTGSTAEMVLLGVAGGFLLAGAWVFQRKEYSDAAV
ncbi:MAG TPA: ABC transporter permease subunit [Planctomycetota bacterium]|nr:ABC transporter permease subunit [Planctomycetota bacterium]